MRLALPLLSLAALALSACATGAVYDTVYGYVPPADEAGKACAAGCLPAFEECRAKEAPAIAECEADRKEETQECRRFGPDSSQTVTGLCGVYPFTCEASAGLGCTETRNACHKGCGGTVTASEVCVANCGA